MHSGSIYKMFHHHSLFISPNQVQHQAHNLRLNHSPVVGSVSRSWQQHYCLLMSSPPPVAEWFKALKSDAVPVVIAQFEPRCGRPHFASTHNDVRVSVAGTAQRPESVSGRRGPCPAYRAR